jgi:hypothetical protein
MTQLFNENQDVYFALMESVKTYLIDRFSIYVWQAAGETFDFETDYIRLRKHLGELRAQMKMIKAFTGIQNKVCFSKYDSMLKEKIGEIQYSKTFGIIENGDRFMEIVADVIDAFMEDFA